MRIQEIDMAVPVGREAPSEEPAKPETTAPDTDLGVLAENLVQAVGQRYRFAWSKQTSATRCRQFENDIKAITKRLASRAASAVTDKQIRADVRVQIYTDVLALANALISASEVRQRRSNLMRGLTIATTGIAVLVAVVMVWVSTYV